VKLKAWQCIGCGRLESQATCLGVCQDRQQELVYAEDYDCLEAIVRQIATITPRDGQHEASYRELQRRARKALQLPRLAVEPGPCQDRQVHHGKERESRRPQCSGYRDAPQV